MTDLHLLAERGELRVSEGVVQGAACTVLVDPVRRFLGWLGQGQSDVRIDSDAAQRGAPRRGLPPQCPQMRKRAGVEGSDSLQLIGQIRGRQPVAADPVEAGLMLDGLIDVRTPVSRALIELRGPGAPPRGVRC